MNSVPPKSFGGLAIQRDKLRPSRRGSVFAVILNGFLEFG